MDLDRRLRSALLVMAIGGVAMVVVGLVRLADGAADPWSLALGAAAIVLAGLIWSRQRKLRK